MTAAILTALAVVALLAAGHLARQLRHTRREVHIARMACGVADDVLRQECADRRHAEGQAAMLRVDLLREKSRGDRLARRVEREQAINARLTRDLYGDDKGAAALAHWVALEADPRDVPAAERCDEERETP